MSPTTVTVFAVLDDEPRALCRLLVHCHSRGWNPVSLRAVSDGARCEVTMRLTVPGDRRGGEAHVRAQLERLVEVRQVTVDALDGVPDGVAFAAVRRKAPWLPSAA
jgi:acetolactate synthase regulatory subunit